MLTVKFLKEYLAICPDDMIIQNQKGEDIIHLCNISNPNAEHEVLIISSEHPLGFCTKCEDRCYPENELKDYYSYCPTCDENLYEFEVEKNSAENMENPLLNVLWCPFEYVEKVCKNCKHWGDGDRMPISNSKQYCGKTNMHTYGSMSCPDHKPIEVVE